jgi:hypothetical protein
VPAITLTTAEEAAVAAADATLDAALSAGMVNPDTSTNTPPTPGYDGLQYAAAGDLRPSVRYVFREAWVALARALASFAEAPTLVGVGGAPAFQNSWQNYDATTYNAAGFYKDPSGRVWLQGLIKLGTSNNIFQLPAGYRPPKTVVFVADANDAFSQVVVDASGTVSQASGSNVFLSLEGLSFRAA